MIAKNATPVVVLEMLTYALIDQRKLQELAKF